MIDSLLRILSLSYDGPSVWRKLCVILFHTFLDAMGISITLTKHAMCWMDPYVDFWFCFAKWKLSKSGEEPSLSYIKCTVLYQLMNPLLPERGLLF